MKKTVVVLLHIGYWAMYLLLLLIFFGFFASEMNNQGQNKSLTEMLVHWMLLMLCTAIIPGLIGFYSFYSFLFERFLKKKKILLFFAGAIGTGIFAGLTGLTVLSIRFNRNIFQQGLDPVLTIFTFLVFIAIVNGVIGLVIRGFISWYGDIKLKEELNRKNYETELALMKAQLNPHFLFNTINNIDVLIQKDPEKASAYLNQLSEILRFMLYETKAEHILLTRELEYIEKYIALQRIRTSNPNYIAYQFDGDPANHKIPAMLFIPFIENAFKYAENKKIERAISIQLQIQKDQITFECSNRYSSAAQESPEQGGLGNELIRKRLNLLYPEKHELTITNENEQYTVRLVLKKHED